jgi:hypothetical protein
MDFTETNAFLFCFVVVVVVVVVVVLRQGFSVALAVLELDL